MICQNEDMIRLLISVEERWYYKSAFPITRMTDAIAVNQEQIAALLNQVLADEFMLYTKTLNAHWNLTGENFYSVHTLLDEQYNELQGVIDEVAERVRVNKGVADGRLSTFLDQTRLEDTSGVISTKQLLEDHERLVSLLRQDLRRAGDDLEDRATEDLLTGLVNKHLMMAWMLRSLR